MTNYEWLINNGKLTEFISDIICATTIPKLSDVCKKYGIHNRGADYFDTDIANWLSGTRTVRPYISRDDTITLINSILGDTTNRFKHFGITDVETVPYSEIIEFAIKKLPTHDIVEDENPGGTEDDQLRMANKK